MAEVNFVQFARRLEQPVYVAVGFGVLGFQRAQVCRRAWQSRLFGPRTATPAPAPAPARPTVAGVAGDAAERLGPLVLGMAGMAAERIGPLVSEASERVAPLLTDTADHWGPLVSDAAERLGPLVSDAVERLPPEAHEFLDAAGALINDLPGEAREIAKEAVAFGRFALQALRAPASRPVTP